jgi:pimeloyl-ACP methyl ester carboxylesterase
MSALMPALYAYTGGRPFDPTLPCVVFLHGALNDHSVWTLAARWCAHHGHSVLAVDLPGHGRSAGPVLPDVEAMADAVLALLAERGVQRTALVGHSMGSLIALEAASRAVPGTVSHLVLVGTAYPMRVSSALLDTAARQPLAAIDQVVAFSHTTLAAKPSYPGPGAWLHGASRALMRQVLARARAWRASHTTSSTTISAPATATPMDWRRPPACRPSPGCAPVSSSVLGTA